MGTSSAEDDSTEGTFDGTEGLGSSYASNLRACVEDS